MMRTRRAADVAAAGGLLTVGVLVVLISRRQPYWHDYAPGPGFVPLWLGLLLSAVASLQLFLLMTASPSAPESSPSTDDQPLTRRTAVLGFLAVAAALLVAPLGFVLAMAAFVAAASWSIDPHRHITNTAATVAIPVCVWLLFGVWLGVPLPRGPLGF
jgi:putative tricarboxylic transport membrane protein